MVHAAHHSTTSQPLVGAASTTETRAAQHLKRQIGPQINNFPDALAAIFLACENHYRLRNVHLD